jgi:phospholipid/cholesterol/gamma-HCH transport system substrate-binding protein
VGAVKNIYIANDSEMIVEMIIDKKVNQYIKNNVIASIGTDGLMGNRIVNLLPGEGKGNPLNDGAEIAVQNPLETEEMMRDFSTTGKNIKSITENLTAITDKLRQNNSLWTLLADTMLPQNLRASMVSIRDISSNALRVTGDLRKFTSKLDEKGNLASVITDTAMGQKVNHIVHNLQHLSDSLNEVTKNMTAITSKISNGSGTAAMLLNDSAFAGNLDASIENIKQSAAKLEETLDALQHSFLLRKQFKKKRTKPKTLND